MLKVSGLKVAYGGIHAIKGIDLEIQEGELVTLIGANGAGKTTAMKAITGLQGWIAGDVHYLGESTKGVESHALLKKGLAMVPEGRGVFARMTIIENLQMGAYTRSDRDGVARDMETVFNYFPILRERTAQDAGLHVKVLAGHQFHAGEARLQHGAEIALQIGLERLQPAGQSLGQPFRQFVQFSCLETHRRSSAAPGRARSSGSPFKSSGRPRC